MFIPVNGHLLNTVSFGAGPTTFLALGGWVANWELWQQPFELLSTRWRCVSFDHRGAGESVVPLEDITPGGLVDDVFGVMDALGIERCILGGESLGAVVALQAVVRAPERFRGVVVIDGAPGVAAGVVKPLIDGAKASFEATIAAFVDRCTPEPDAAPMRRWGRDMLLRSGGPAAARMFECYLERREPPVELERVRIPALVIHGTLDAIVPFAYGERTAKAIPDATFVRLDGVGHVPTVTRPKAVVDAILTWSAERLGDDSRQVA